MLDLADLTSALTTDYGGDRNERLRAYVELHITSDPGALVLTVNHDNGGVERFDVHITRRITEPAGWATTPTSFELAEHERAEKLTAGRV